MRYEAVVAAGFAVLLALGPAAASKPPKPAACPGGRFPVSGASLVPGGDADAIVIDATQVSIASGCPATAAKRKLTRQGTVLTTRWKGCGSLTGRVTLVAKLDGATCESLSARFRSAKPRINRKLTSQFALPADALGGPRSTPPAGAMTVDPAQWADIIRRPDFRSIGPDQLAQDAAAQAASDAANAQTVADFLVQNPDFAAQYTGGVDPNDGAVTPADDGNFDDTFTDATGASRMVITHGRRFVNGAVAGSLRTFPTDQNQLLIYSNAYDGLAGIDPALPGQFDLPPPAQIQDAATLRRLNSRIVDLLDRVIPFVPPGGLPPAGYPASCPAEEGSGDGTDRYGDTSPACAHKPNGVWNNVAWPLKFYATCVKDQAGRGTCWDFATTGATELWVAKKYKRWINLAEQHMNFLTKHIWYPSNYGDGAWPSDALTKIVDTDYRFPFEDAWDYNPSRARTANDTTGTYSNSCVGYGGGESAFCSDTNHQGMLICVNILGATFCGAIGPTITTTSGFRPTQWGSLWDSSNPTFSLGSMLWGIAIFQKPVVYSFLVAPSWDQNVNGYVTYRGPHCPVTTGSDGRPVCNGAPGCECDRGGHAVLVTGWIDNTSLPAGAPAASGGGYLIMKNSWGNCFGDSGYAYVPYDWVKAYGLAAEVVGDIN